MEPKAQWTKTSLGQWSCQPTKYCNNSTTTYGQPGKFPVLKKKSWSLFSNVLDNHPLFHEHSHSSWSSPNFAIGYLFFSCYCMMVTRTLENPLFLAIESLVNLGSFHTKHSVTGYWCPSGCSHCRATLVVLTSKLLVSLTSEYTIPMSYLAMDSSPPQVSIVCKRRLNSWHWVWLRQCLEHSRRRVTVQSLFFSDSFESSHGFSDNTPSIRHGMFCVKESLDALDIQLSHP